MVPARPTSPDDARRDEKVVDLPRPGAVSVAPVASISLRIVPLVIGSLLATLVGTWLVWFAVYWQAKQTGEEILAACQRVMPEAVQRCVDTVVLQRGGLRR